MASRELRTLSNSKGGFPYLLDVFCLGKSTRIKNIIRFSKGTNISSWSTWNRWHFRHHTQHSCVALNAPCGCPKRNPLRLYRAAVKQWCETSAAGDTNLTSSSDTTTAASASYIWRQTL